MHSNLNTESAVLILAQHDVNIKEHAQSGGEQSCCEMVKSQLASALKEYVSTKEQQPQVDNRQKEPTDEFDGNKHKLIKLIEQLNTNQLRGIIPIVKSYQITDNNNAS